MMGDIAQTEDLTVTLRIEAVTQAGIERIEIRNGTEVLETIKGYGPGELGGRIRVIWRGAEYRGRRRETTWRGLAKFKDAAIRKWQPINAWNQERLLKTVNNDTVVFDAITTGNFGGFDAWLAECPHASLEIETNHGSLTENLSHLKVEEAILEAGGLERCIRVFCLPSIIDCKPFSARIPNSLISDHITSLCQHAGYCLYHSRCSPPLPKQ